MISSGELYFRNIFPEIYVTGNISWKYFPEINSRKAYGRGFPFSDLGGCGGRPVFCVRPKTRLSADRCFVSAKRQLLEKTGVSSPRNAYFYKKTLFRLRDRSKTGVFLKKI